MNRRLLLLSSLALICSCSSPPSGDSPPARQPVRIEHPQIALDTAGKPIAVWASVTRDGTADIHFGRPTLPDLNVARLQTLNSEPGSAVAGRQVGPRVAVGKSGDIYVTWVDRSLDDEGDIFFSRSLDGGTTFSKPSIVNDDGHHAGQEYCDITVRDDGSVAIVWLDERDAPSEEENRKQVYLAVSSDRGKSFSKNLALSDHPQGACPCCRPGISSSAGNGAVVVYRKRVPGGLRIAAREYRDDQIAPEVYVSERWNFEACPIDGPAVLASGDELLVAWKDGTSGREEVWFARSRAGRTEFGQKERLGSSREPRLLEGSTTLLGPDFRRAVLARSGDSEYAAWEDTDGYLWIQQLNSAELEQLWTENSSISASSASIAVDTKHVHWLFVDETYDESLLASTGLPKSELRYLRTER
ncbi:MAG: sialidase family protein [Planctomycetota bacterium]